MKTSTGSTGTVELKNHPAIRNCCGHFRTIHSIKAQQAFSGS